MKEVYPENKLSDIVIFDGYSNVQLGARLLTVNFPKLTVMSGVKHTVSLFSMMCLKYQLFIKRFLPKK